MGKGSEKSRIRERERETYLHVGDNEGGRDKNVFFDGSAFVYVPITHVRIIWNKYGDAARKRCHHMKARE